MEDSGTQGLQMSKSRLVWFIVIATALLVGLAGRVWLTTLSVRWAYVWDHYDNIGMGLTAERFGLTKVYSVPADRNPLMLGQVHPGGGERPVVQERRPPRVANYPPLGIVVYWLQSKMLALPDRTMNVDLVWPDCGVRRTVTVDLTGPSMEEMAARLEEQELPQCRGHGHRIEADPSLMVNTFRTRLIMSLPSVLAELILAVGMFLLGRELAGPRAGLLAACVCWLFPPLAMDSSFWGQTDSWMLGPTVFFLWFMLRRRWAIAGLCAALTCLLKPQGMFLGPVALFGAAIVTRTQAESQAPSWTPGFLRQGLGSLLAPVGRSSAWLFIVRMAEMCVAGGLAILILTLPWMISDGLNWLDKSYVANFRMYADTTLSAFNVWYVDALCVDAGGAPEGLDAKATLLGVAKTSWGQLLTLAAMVVLAVTSWRKYRQKQAAGLVIFSGLWLWSTFMWPTGVHERYVVYGMPLVILSAAALKRLWPAVAVLAIVGAAEMTHNVWVKRPVGTYAKYAKNLMERVYSIPPNQRPPQAALDRHLADARQEIGKLRGESVGWEYLVTLGSLAAYFWAAVAAFWRRRAALPAAPSPHREGPRRKHRR